MKFLIILPVLASILIAGSIFGVSESFAQSEGMCAPQNYKSIAKNAAAIFSGTVLSEESLNEEFHHNVQFKIDELFVGNYDNFLNVITSEFRMSYSEPVGGDPFIVGEKYLVFAEELENNVLYADSSGCGGSFVIPISSGLYGGGLGKNCSANLHLECLDRCGLYHKPNTPEPTCLSLCYNRNLDQCQPDTNLISEPYVAQNYVIGKVKWIQAKLPISLEKGIVQVIEPDMNTDQNKIENFTIDVWSDSDKGGADVLMTETQIDSGIFEGFFWLDSNEGGSNHVRVHNGDYVTARYIDTTLPPDFDVSETPIISSVLLTEDFVLKPNIILSPLKQISNGIFPENVACKSGMKLILKSSDVSPACVKSSSVEKLIERGWGLNSKGVYPIPSDESPQCPSCEIMVSWGTSVWGSTTENIATNEKIFYIDSPILGNETQISLPMSEDIWNSILSLMDFEKFNSLPNTIGCPGCADGKVFWIKFTNSTKTKSISFELQDIPPELVQLHNKLQETTQTAKSSIDTTN